MLTNYAVTIPPGGRKDTFVQTVITWSFEEKVFRTGGLDADQDGGCYQGYHENAEYNRRMNMKIIMVSD